MDYSRRVALGSLASARGMIDPAAALYWAFIAGMQAAGRDYIAAKREAAALDLVPPYLQNAEPATTAETAE